MPSAHSHRRRLIAVAAVVVAATAITASHGLQPTPRYALPNASTPGAVRSTNPSVVCVAGYTATVRVALTPAQARQVDAAYGWTSAPGKQEYDHLIPLELGGDNGPRNIWPQPIAQAHVKDGLENALHAQACRQHTVAALQSAQACIRTDWVACWKREGQP